MTPQTTDNDWPTDIPTLDDKVAIVTGAGSSPEGLPGTGAAIAYALAIRGVKVFLVEKDRQRAENTQQRIHARGGFADIVTADITSFDECERVIAEVSDAAGRLDILVNNVGMMPAADVERHDRGAVWGQTLTLNLTAPRNLIVCAAPQMAGSHDSSIINIVSIAAMRASSSLAYAASKGGLIAMTRAAARLYGADGIRVNAVAPGYVETPMAGPRLADLRQIGAQPSMLQTRGTAWDIADAVVYLAGEQARWVTGVTLPVDAGTTALLPSGARTPAPVPPAGG